MKGWNSYNSVSPKWRMEYDPKVVNGLAFFIYSNYRILPQRALARYNFGGPLYRVPWRIQRVVRHIP